MSKSNQTVEKTRKRISEAFFRVLETKKYSSIKIDEVAKEAGCSRRTFYRSFGNKEEVLRYHFRKIAQNHFNALEPLTHFDSYRLTLEYFTFWDENRYFLKLFNDNDLSFTTFANLFQFTIVLLKQRLDSCCKDFDKTGSYYKFLAGGYLATLYSWIVDNMSETPEEIAESIANSNQTLMEQAKQSTSASTSEQGLDPLPSPTFAELAVSALVNEPAKETDQNVAAATALFNPENEKNNILQPEE